jgi:hypothetical protein
MTPPAKGRRVVPIGELVVSPGWWPWGGRAKELVYMKTRVPINHTLRVGQKYIVYAVPVGGRGK